MVEAVVVFNKSGCRSRFVAESNLGYVYLEWYGGADPMEGEVLIGELHSYGMKEAYSLNTRRKTQVWVDDYMLSRSRVQEKLREHCN